MNKSSFKDYFSSQSLDYAKFRPSYPPALFEFLASSSAQQTQVWDCATGSGQAAADLAKHFDYIIATDASAKQISQAVPVDGIEYRVCSAEESGLAEQSVDLVVVAQALHWFDLPVFYQEVRRVLKPMGQIAIWSYDRLQINVDIDAVIESLYSDVLGSYWPPERALVESGYRDLEFPFHEQAVPDFAMTADWSLESLLGYLQTWSSVQAYHAKHGVNPVAEFVEPLAQLWGESDTKRPVVWPLTVKLGTLA